ncbi:MAG: hypothetical protein LLG20_01560 [Acidobacteriales bacterium]|nr:hypothetical protein [Terriglobales bacterium]
MLITALTWLLLTAVPQYKTAPIDLENVPCRVRDCLTSLGPGYQITKRLNPFYVQGDFDGNGAADYAVSITELKSHKEGFVVCFSASPLKSEVLAAGRALPVEEGALVDDFAMIDIWGTATRCGSRKRDCLYLEKSEAGGGFLIWNGDRFVWNQQGI